MPRLASALVLALLAASPAIAQPPAAHYESRPPQVSYGPHLPIYKSGGQILGRDGIYPYDSGEYLLSGTDGLARFSGGFTMELPGAPGVATGKHRFHSRPGLFRR
jgi:hypothetical protein